MAVFRSQNMSKVEIIFNDMQLAKQFIHEMGHSEYIQFDDLQKNTSSLNKPYSRDLVKIKEILNQINAIQQIMNRYKSSTRSIEHKSDENKETDDGKYDNDTKLKHDDISNIYERLQKSQIDEGRIKKELIKQNNITRSLSSDINLFITKQQTKYQQEYNQYFVGFVTNSQRVSFQRQIYLISKSNAIIIFHQDGNENLFLIFYNENGNDHRIKNSLYRICKLMNIEICYDSNIIKEDEKNKEKLLWHSIKKSEELKGNHKEIIDKLQRDTIENELKIKEWKHLLLRQKAIKTVLNMSDIQQINDGMELIKMNGWCCTSKKEMIQQIFLQITSNQSECNLSFQDISDYDQTQIAPTSLENDCVLL